MGGISGRLKIKSLEVYSLNDPFAKGSTLQKTDLLNIPSYQFVDFGAFFFSVQMYTAILLEGLEFVFYLVFMTDF